MDFRKKLERRARIVARLRHFFNVRNYLEVDTPQLATTPIPERYIELFTTHFLRPDYSVESPEATRKTTLFLLPSPEYYLKRMLALGSGNIFQIAHSFRNYESTGPHHNPEFTMLEWYTIDADGVDSLALTTELLVELGVESPPLVLTVTEAFRRWAGIDLDDLLDGVAPLMSPLTEEEFQRLFLTEVEPHIPPDRPVFLTSYPALIPTLAKTDPEGRYAERWELYLGGMEIANCYSEETDPEVIDRFIAEEGVIKTKTARVPHPPPKNYLQPPRSLPRSSGVALGVDRLVMYLTGATSIETVIPFSVSTMISE